MAAAEIEQFKREKSGARGRRRRREDHGRRAAARGDEHGWPQGPARRDIRCVVSVSMLTEGWDTNTVTHILGVRAFGTQLLVRAGGRPRAAPAVLRAEGRRLFGVEYADILGIRGGSMP